MASNEPQNPVAMRDTNHFIVVQSVSNLMSNECESMSLNCFIYPVYLITQQNT